MNDAPAENIVLACARLLESPAAAQTLAEIAGVLADAQREIDSANPACSACGRCCLFESAGHRLYVSTGELALLVSSGVPALPAAPLHCPWQVDGKCTARDSRPLGCRVFFCQTDLTEIYEKSHRKIVDIHKKRGVSYFYAEMTSAAGEFHGVFAKK